MMTCETLVCSLVEDELKEGQIVTVTMMLAVAWTTVTLCQMMTRVVDLFLHQQRLLPAGILFLCIQQTFKQNHTVTQAHHKTL
jgi:hypothetical protein